MICFYRVFFFTAMGKSVHGQRGVRTPNPQAGPFPLFHWTGRLLFVVSVAGDTKSFPKDNIR